MVQTREYKSAETFIDEYVEQTSNRKDRILVKDLYDQYCESSKQTIGKTTFNRILKDEGFSIMKGNSNRLTIFYVKSSWL